MGERERCSIQEMHRSLNRWFIADASDVDRCNDIKAISAYPLWQTVMRVDYNSNDVN